MFLSVVDGIFNIYYNAASFVSFFFILMSVCLESLFRASNSSFLRFICGFIGSNSLGSLEGRGGEGN